MNKYFRNLKFNKQNGILLLAAFGAYKIFLKSFEILQELRTILFGRFDKSRYGNNYWAVVSGASDGIGLGFVEEFAKRGIHVVLLVRNKEKSEQVVNNLKVTHPNVNFKIVIIDFTTTDLNEYERVYKEIENLDIGILVNNVGTSENLQSGSLESVKNVLLVNIWPQTFLTKLLIKKLGNRQSKSAVINLSSGAGVAPFPIWSLYSATKAFNDFLSRALGFEYQKKIDFQSLMPLTVISPLSQGLPYDCFAITRNQCAEGSLNRLKYSENTQGHFIHRIQGFLHFGILPQSLQKYDIKRWVNKMEKSIVEFEKKQKQQ